MHNNQKEIDGQNKQSVMAIIRHDVCHILEYVHHLLRLVHRRAHISQNARNAVIEGITGIHRKLASLDQIALPLRSVHQQPSVQSVVHIRRQHVLHDGILECDGATIHSLPTQRTECMWRCGEAKERRSRTAVLVTGRRSAPIRPDFRNSRFPSESEHDREATKTTIRVVWRGIDTSTALVTQSEAKSIRRENSTWEEARASWG